MPFVMYYCYTYFGLVSILRICKIWCDQPGSSLDEQVDSFIIHVQSWLASEPLGSVGLVKPCAWQIIMVSVLRQVSTCGQRVSLWAYKRNKRPMPWGGRLSWCVITGPGMNTENLIEQHTTETLVLLSSHNLEQTKKKHRRIVFGLCARLAEHTALSSS